MKRHIDKVHLGEIFVCRFCPFKAQKKISVIEHAKKAHPLNDLSKVIFEKVLSQKKNPLSIENRNGNCPTCGKYFRKGLSKHIRKAHAEYIIDKDWQINEKNLKEVPDIKIKKERRKTQMKIKKKKIPRPRLKTCPHCEREFSREENLMRHIAFTHKGHSFECNFCTKHFKDKRPLLRHTVPAAQVRILTK